MVELRKHEKEEKALRREQVSNHIYLNYHYYSCHVSGWPVAFMLSEKHFITALLCNILIIL